MTDTSQLSALVVRNIGDLEATITHVSKMEDRLIEEAVGLVRSTFDESEWHIHEDVEERELWFAPRHWLQAGRKQVTADYKIELTEQDGPNGDTDHTWLAEFLGNGPEEAEVALYLKGETFKPKRWRLLLASGSAVIERLVAKGFMQDDEQQLYVPLLLDQEALAAGFEADDLTTALRPVRDALAIIVAARDDLDALVALDRAAG